MATYLVGGQPSGLNPSVDGVLSQRQGAVKRLYRAALGTEQHHGKSVPGASNLGRLADWPTQHPEGQSSPRRPH